MLGSDPVSAALDDLKAVATIRIAITLLFGLVIPVGISERSPEVLAIWPCVLVVLLLLGIGMMIRARHAARPSLYWLAVGAPIVAGMLFVLGFVFDRLHDRPMTLVAFGASPTAFVVLDLWLIRARPNPHPILEHDATRERRAKLMVRRLLKARIAIVLVACALFPVVAEDSYFGWALANASALLALGIAMIFAGLRTGDRRPALVVFGAPICAAGLLVVLDQVPWQPSEFGVARALVCLILAMIPLADFWLLISPLPASDDEGPGDRLRLLADRIRETVLSQPEYRLRHRVVRVTRTVLWTIVRWSLPFLPLALLYAALASPPNSIVLYLLMIAVLLFVVAISPAIQESRNAPWGYRSTENVDGEIALLTRLSAGDPFGIYLRTFGLSSDDGAVTAALQDCRRCPFFALEDVRHKTELVIPSMWVPEKHWQKVVFPLIEASSIVVVDMSMVSQPRPGLRAELDFIQASKLTAKTIVVASPNNSSIGSSEPMTILAADLPNQLLAMLRRLGLEPESGRHSGESVSKQNTYD